MYEPPVMKFEEITFFERIAKDDCWNNNSFVFDNPFTKCEEFYPITISSGEKCGDRETKSAIEQALCHLNILHDIKYIIYSLFACDKQNTKMWGFRINKCS